MTPFPEAGASPSTTDPLPNKEVVRSVYRGNRKAALCGGFLRLRGRDSNPNFLIQSQASYH